MEYQCALSVADCIMRVISCSRALCDDNQADIIDYFNSTSRYDDLLNIDNIFLTKFKLRIDQICLMRLQLNKTDSSDTEAPILIQIHRYNR